MILSPSPSAASLGEGHTAGLFVPGAQPASSSPTRIHQLTISPKQLQVGPAQRFEDDPRSKCLKRFISLFSGPPWFPFQLLCLLIETIA